MAEESGVAPRARSSEPLAEALAGVVEVLRTPGLSRVLALHGFAYSRIGSA